MNSVAFLCPSCFHNLRAPTIASGKSKPCPHCGKNVRVPFIRQPSSYVSVKPDATSITALCTVGAAYFMGFMSRGLRRGSDTQAYQQAVGGIAALDKELGFPSQQLWVGLFVIVVFFAAVMVVTALCHWDRHNSSSRVLAIVSGLLLMPLLLGCGMIAVFG